MYKCAKCKKQSKAREPQHTLITAYKVKEYNNDGKTKNPEKRLTYGRETISEIKVCKDCGGGH